MGRTPGASRAMARAALVALVIATLAAASLAQDPEKAKPAPPPPPPPPPSVGIALQVAPHATQPGTYEAKALLTDGVTGRRLSQSWVAVKVGSFADMRATMRPESGGGAKVDVYMTVAIGAEENEASLTTSYRHKGRLLLKQETKIALGGSVG
jgi:hypothetical protein